MSEAWRRIGRDLRARRHIEVYVIAGLSIVIAVLSVVGDVVGEEVRWSVVLGALGLLTYQIAVPSRAQRFDTVLLDRAAFDDTTLGSRLAGAREVWIYGPSAVNLLTSDVADRLRSGPLNRPAGVVRVAVLDPEQPAAIEIARRQLDDSLHYPSVRLPKAIDVTVDRLEQMAAWDTPGAFEYRFAPFNPGFSLVALDPGTAHGKLIVEFHGLRNESTGNRMHVELTQESSEYWYAYWRAQFADLWEMARAP